MSNDNGVAPTKHKSTKVGLPPPSAGPVRKSEKIVGTGQRSRRGEFEVSGRHSNVGGTEDLNRKINGLGKSRSNTSHAFVAPDRGLSGDNNTNTKNPEKFQRRAQSTLGSYAHTFDASNRVNWANQGDNFGKHPILEAIKKHGFEATPDIVSNEANLGPRGPNRYRIGSPKKFQAGGYDENPSEEINTDPNQRSRASSEPPNRRLVFMRQGEEAVFSDKGKGPSVLESQATFGDIKSSKSTSAKRKSPLSRKPVTPPCCTCKSGPSPEKETIKSPKITQSSPPKKKKARAKPSGQKADTIISPFTSPVFVIITDVRDKDGDKTEGNQKSDAQLMDTEQSKAYLSTVNLSGCVCGDENTPDSKKTEPKDTEEKKDATSSTAQQTKEPETKEDEVQCMPVYEEPVCVERGGKSDRSPPTSPRRKKKESAPERSQSPSPPRTAPLGIRVRKSKKKKEDATNGKDGNGKREQSKSPNERNTRRSPTPTLKGKDPVPSRSKSSGPTCASPRCRDVLTSKSKSQTNVSSSKHAILEGQSPPRRKCEGIKPPPCKGKKRGKPKDPFANWFCRPKRRQPRRDFFGSIAQAFGNQLQNIACRNNRLMPFPGMTGLYIPDVGMNSLFLPPYAYDYDEGDDDNQDPSRKGRRSPESDSEATHLLQSKDEHSVSRQFQQEPKAGTSEIKKPPYVNAKNNSVESKGKNTASTFASDRDGSQATTVTARTSDPVKDTQSEPKKSEQEKISEPEIPEERKSSHRGTVRSVTESVRSEQSRKTVSHKSSQSGGKKSVRSERSFESRKVSDKTEIVQRKSLDSVKSEPRGDSIGSERTIEFRKSDDSKYLPDTRESERQSYGSERQKKSLDSVKSEPRGPEEWRGDSKESERKTEFRKSDDSKYLPDTRESERQSYESERQKKSLDSVKSEPRGPQEWRGSSKESERTFEFRKSDDSKYLPETRESERQSYGSERQKKSLDSVKSEPRGPEEWRGDSKESERTTEFRKSDDSKYLPDTHESERQSYESERQSYESERQKKSLDSVKSEPRGPEEWRGSSKESERTFEFRKSDDSKYLLDTRESERQSYGSERQSCGSERKSYESERRSFESKITLEKEEPASVKESNESFQSVESGKKTEHTSLQESHKTLVSNKSLESKESCAETAYIEQQKSIRESWEQKVEKIDSCSTTPECITPFASPTGVPSQGYPDICRQEEGIPCGEIIEESCFKLRATVHSRKETMTVDMHECQQSRSRDRSNEKRPSSGRRTSQRPPLDYRSHGRVGSRKSSLEKSDSPGRTPSKKASVENRLGSRKKTSSRRRYESRPEPYLDGTEPVTVDQITDDDDQILVPSKTGTTCGKFSQMDCDEWMRSTVGRTVLDNRESIMVEGDKRRSEERRPSKTGTTCGKFSEMDCDEWMNSTIGRTVLDNRESIMVKEDDGRSEESRPASSPMQESVTERDQHMDQTTESESAHHDNQHISSYSNVPQDYTYAHKQGDDAPPSSVCSEEDTKTQSCEDIPYSVFNEEQEGKTSCSPRWTLESRKRLASGYNERTIRVSSSRNSMSPSSECSGYKVKIKRWKDGALTDEGSTGTRDIEGCERYSRRKASGFPGRTLKPRTSYESRDMERTQTRRSFVDQYQEEDAGEHISQRQRRSDVYEKDLDNECDREQTLSHKSKRASHLYADRSYEDEDSSNSDSCSSCENDFYHRKDKQIKKYSSASPTKRVKRERKNHDEILPYSNKDIKPKTRTSIANESEDNCMDPCSKWLGSHGQESSFKPPCGGTVRRLKGVSIRLRTHSTDDSESEYVKSIRQAPTSCGGVRSHSIKELPHPDRSKRDSYSQEKESELSQSESNSTNCSRDRESHRNSQLKNHSRKSSKARSDGLYDPAMTAPNRLSRSSSLSASKESQFLRRSPSGQDKEERARESNRSRSFTYEEHCEDLSPFNAEPEHHSSDSERHHPEECEKRSDGRASSAQSHRDSGSSDDACKQKPAPKLKGRITYRCTNSTTDSERSPNAKTTTVAVQNGTVKMVNSPKGIRIRRRNPNEIDSCSSTDESRSVTPTNDCQSVLLSSTGRLKRNSESFLSDSCMERYERDAQYIKDRQRRLRNSEMSKMRANESSCSGSCVPEADFLSERGWEENPVPAPRMRLVLKSSTGGGGYCRNGNEMSGTDEQMARQWFKGAYRSRSNSARRKYRCEGYCEGKIDLFGQVITPEQPFQLETKHMFVPQTNSATSDTRSGDEFDRSYNKRPVESVDRIVISPDELGYFKEEKCVDSDKHKNLPKKVACRRRPQNEESLKNNTSTESSSLVNKFLSLKNFFIPDNENGDDFEGTRGSRQPRSVPMIIHPRSESVGPRLRSQLIGGGSSLRCGRQSPQDYERVEGTLYEGHFESGADMFDHNDEFGSLVPVARNKNCSSSAECDRNSSSGADVLYAGYAYTSGVIDTLRLLDIDNVSTSPSIKHSPSSTDSETGIERTVQINQSDDHLTRIAKSLPLLAPASKNSDEAFEFIRQNSLRALLYASTMSMSTMAWPTYSLLTRPFGRRGSTYPGPKSPSPVKMKSSLPVESRNSPDQVSVFGVSNNSDNMIDQSANKNTISGKRLDHKSPTVQGKSQEASPDKRVSHATIQDDEDGSDADANIKDSAKHSFVKRKDSVKLDSKDNTKENCRKPWKISNSQLSPCRQTLLDGSMFSNKIKSPHQEDSDMTIRRIHLDEEEESRLRNAIFQKLNTDPELMSLPLYFKESDLNLNKRTRSKCHDYSDTASTASSDFDQTKSVSRDIKSMGDFVDKNLGKISPSDKVKVFVLTTTEPSCDDKVGSCNEDVSTSASENFEPNVFPFETSKKSHNEQLCSKLLRKSIKIYDNGNEEFRILTRNPPSDENESESEMNESRDSVEDENSLVNKRCLTSDKTLTKYNDPYSSDALYRFYNNRHSQLKKVYEATSFPLDRPEETENRNNIQRPEKDSTLTNMTSTKVGVSPTRQRSWDSGEAESYESLKLKVRQSTHDDEDEADEGVEVTYTENYKNSFSCPESECESESKPNARTREKSAYKPASPCHGFNENRGIDTKFQTNSDEIPRQLIEELSSLCKCGWDILNRMKTEHEESNRPECNKSTLTSNSQSLHVKSGAPEEGGPTNKLNISSNPQQTQGDAQKAEVMGSVLHEWSMGKDITASNVCGGDSNNSVSRLQRQVTAVKGNCLPQDVEVFETSRVDVNQSRRSACDSNRTDTQGSTADQVLKATPDIDLDDLKIFEEIPTHATDEQILKKTEYNFNPFQSLIDDKVKVFFDRALQKWTSPDRKRCLFLGENSKDVKNDQAIKSQPCVFVEKNNKEVTNDQVMKSQPCDLPSTSSKRKIRSVPPLSFHTEDPTSSSQSITSTIISKASEQPQKEGSLVLLSIPSSRKHRPGEKSKTFKEQLMDWIKSTIPKAMNLTSITEEYQEKNRYRKGQKRSQSESRTRKIKRTRAPKMRPSSSSSLAVRSESSDILNSTNDYASDSHGWLLNHNTSRSDDEEKDSGSGTRRNRRRNPPRQREPPQRRQSTPVSVNRRLPPRQQKVGPDVRQPRSKVGKSPESLRRKRAQSAPGTISNSKAGRPKAVTKQHKPGGSKPSGKDKAGCSSSKEGKVPKMIRHSTPIKLPEEKRAVEEKGKPKTVRTFNTIGISRVANALQNAPKAHCHHMSFYLDSTADDEQVENVDPHDFESRTECETFESCLLTPIKEESHSFDSTKPTDFDTFVSECTSRLHDITCTQRKSDSETKTSSAAKTSKQDFRENETLEFSPKKQVCKDEQPVFSEGDDSDPISSDFCRKVRSAKMPMTNSVYEGATERDAAEVTAFFRSALPVGFGRIPIAGVKPPRYRGPFKSTFLRNEMIHSGMSLNNPRRVAETGKPEEVLMKQYSGFVTKNTWRDVTSKTYHLEDRNYNRKKFASETTRILHSFDTLQYSEPPAPPQEHGMTSYVSSSKRPSTTYPLLYYNYMESDYKSRFLQSKSLDFNDFFAASRMRSAPNKISSEQWRSEPIYSADVPKFGEFQGDFMRKNWNESANNGNDTPTSNESSGGDEPDMEEEPKKETAAPNPVNRNQGATIVVPTDRLKPDVKKKDSRACRVSENNYVAHICNTSSDERFCHGCDQSCVSYDFLHSHSKNSRLSNLAAKNINGSGNMFDRPPQSDEDLRAACRVFRNECSGDSDDDFTSAVEGTVHYAPGNKIMPRLLRKEDQEMDDTCNHRDPTHFTIGDGPIGQFDTFSRIPREDLLMNMSPMDDDQDAVFCYPQEMSKRSTDHPAIQATCHDSKPGRLEREFRPSLSQSQLLDKAIYGGRSYCGQGDILNKRNFTQWYTDEDGKDQRRQANAGNYGSHSDGWNKRLKSEDAAAQVSELDDEEDDELEDFEDEEGEEDDEEDAEDDDDDDDDEDVDIDEDGRELDKEICCEEKEPHTSNKNTQDVEMLEGSKSSMARSERCMAESQRHVRDISQNKQSGSGPRAMAIISSHYKDLGSKIVSRKRSAAQDKQAHAKGGLGHQKFSLEQIKVPAIEKERVRFACDENGDWAEIGRGSYGCVYLGLLDGVIEVAIKDFYESSSWDLVIHEARMLMFLQDTAITPKFYGLRRRFDVTKQPSEYCIVMEYFGDGRTLFNVMSDKMSLAGEEWMDIVGQLVAGLRLIHRKNVLINDLKADNILIDLTGGRKIIRYIDVGMATYKQGLTFQLPQDQMSKYNFLAPEVREGARTTTRSDIYSLGYMLDQMCRLADVALGGLKKLVTRCMEKNPARRPDVDDIVSQVHRFIASKASVKVVGKSSPQEQFLLTNSI